MVVPNSPHALWVRMTRFADGETSDARLWAVLFERDVPTIAREVLPLDALEAGDDPEVLVRVGEAVLRRGSSEGHCGDLKWSFTFDTEGAVAPRLPHVPEGAPLGTHATHPFAEAPVDGFVEVDGRRLSLAGGLFTQMHIWGTARVPWLRWAWVPALDRGGALELTAVAPLDRGPSLCSLWARLDGEEIRRTGLLTSVAAQVVCPRPGVMHHVATWSGRRVVVRIWAPSESFACWDYRQPGGGALHIAQSDLARCEVEVYQRRGLGWAPTRRYTSLCAALEIHGREIAPGWAYRAWDDGRDTSVPVPVATVPGPPVDGAWIQTPPPPRIVALGLTYAAHRNETGSGEDCAIFELDPESWVGGDGRALRPSSEALRAAVADLSPAIAEALGEFIPALLDYEVELGLVLLDGLTEGVTPRVGLVLANDLSARTLQILGDTSDDPMAWWRAAKSLPGFTPTTARAWVPAHFDLEIWPDIRIRTQVNGEVRQDASVRELVMSPRQMLARVLAHSGPLPPGSLVLTGTPAGVALAVPRWKRAIAQRLLDPVGRFRAAVGAFSAGQAFLRPGDEVRLEADYLGALTHLIVAG